MLKAEFNNYQEFYEWRSDLEDEGYRVTSTSDTEKDIYTIQIERTDLVPKDMQDPGEPFKEV